MSCQYCGLNGHHDQACPGEMSQTWALGYQNGQSGEDNKEPSNREFCLGYARGVHEVQFLPWLKE